MSNFKLLIIYLIAINVIAYLCMVTDKYLAIRKSRRIPENTLFLMALLLGAGGIFLGMQLPVKHKSSKAVFKWGIPLLVLLNGVVVYYLVK